MNDAKISAIDLIKKKDLINSKKKKVTEIEVEGMGVFSFRVPTLEDISNSEAFKGGKMADEHLVLNCCVQPNLKDGELLKEFGAVEPIDIIHKVFLIGEVKMIAVKILESAGYREDQIKVIDSVKNS